MSLDNETIIPKVLSRYIGNTFPSRNETVKGIDCFTLLPRCSYLIGQDMMTNGDWVGSCGLRYRVQLCCHGNSYRIMFVIMQSRQELTVLLFPGIQRAAI